MNAAIETREIITVMAGGNCLRGTYHRSHDDRSSLRSCLRRTNRIGVVFLNAGFLPRASVGDSAVYWADSFANCGYPSFRFDLPGLGDSDGDAPTDLLDFINAGGYAPILADAVKEIIKRFSLSGVVILGHCGGATTALYTAALSKECKGLVLMDPYFFLPEERTKIRDDLSHWVSLSRVGALASKLYYCLKHIRLLILRNRPPRNANLPLLRCTKQLTSAGMPILILKAPALKTRGTKPRIGEFDYLGYLRELSGRDSSIVVEFIESTNHSFADVDGRVAVRQHAEQWLNAAASRGLVAESGESCRAACG